MYHTHLRQNFVETREKPIWNKRNNTEPYLKQQDWLGEGQKQPPPTLLHSEGSRRHSEALPSSTVIFYIISRIPNAPLSHTTSSPPEHIHLDRPVSIYSHCFYVVHYPPDP